MARRQEREKEVDAILNSIGESRPDVDLLVQTWLAHPGVNCAWYKVLCFKSGYRAVKEICLFVDATTEGGIVRGTWKDLANRLNFDWRDIRIIENRCGRMSPTLWVLDEYGKKADATLAAVLNALYTEGRKDILLATQQYIENLLEECARRAQRTAMELVAFDDDIHSDSGYAESNDCESTTFELRYQEEGQSIKGDLLGAPSAEHQNHLTTPSQVLGQTPSKIALLTFASDGAEAAREVAAIFKRQRSGLPNMGAVVLEDYREYLEIDAWSTVQKWFHDVDYIIPILTPEYLSTVLPSSQDTEPSEKDYEPKSLDTQYARTIYSLMTNEYTRKFNCLNLRVRALIPDKYVATLKSHAALTASLFWPWKKISEADSLAVSLLNRNYIAPKSSPTPQKNAKC